MPTVCRPKMGLQGIGLEVMRDVVPPSESSPSNGGGRQTRGT